MDWDRNYWIAAAALAAAACLAAPGTALEKRARLSVGGDADSCAALEVRSSGQVARSDESFTLPPGAALEIDAASNGRIRVRGADRADFAIQACKVAAAETAADADAVLRQVAVSLHGSRFTAAGPSSGEWQVVYLVQAPRNAALDLEARNGPISVEGVSGKIRTRAGNGPISLRDCGGEIQARTGNGPISFSGKGGDVSLSAENGPLSIRLSGAEWTGSRLEARTNNGPVSLRMPAGFRSGVQVDSSGHAPFACQVAGCRDARPEQSGGTKSVRWNGPNPVVRVSTRNGPVAVHSDERLI